MNYQFWFFCFSWKVTSCLLTHVQWLYKKCWYFVFRASSQSSFATLLQFRPPISLKPLSIWHEKCTYSLWLIISREVKKISKMAWLTPCASAKAIAHFRISLQWQLFSNSLLLNSAFRSSNAGMSFLYIFRELTLSHVTLLRLYVFLWNFM